MNIHSQFTKYASIRHSIRHATSKIVGENLSESHNPKRERGASAVAVLTLANVSGCEERSPGYHQRTISDLLKRLPEEGTDLLEAFRLYWNFGRAELSQPSLRRGTRCSKSRARGRRGVVVICALVCLSVATSLMVTTTHQALSARRQGHRQWQLRQTQYLLDAGICRALAGLAADDAYAGESWQPAGALPGFDTVVVEIDIKPLGNEPARQQVTVLAQIGRGESLASQTQRSQTFVYSSAEQVTSFNSK